MLFSSVGAVIGPELVGNRENLPGVRGLLFRIKRISLTSGEFSFSISRNFSYPTRFTQPFYEEVMKWACLKYLERCLPEAPA
jgi:hypothetical protein